jgi:hypothetical protein
MEEDKNCVDLITGNCITSNKRTATINNSKTENSISWNTLFTTSGRPLLGCDISFWPRMIVPS